MVKLDTFLTCGGKLKAEKAVAACGCSIHPVDTPGTAVPLRTAEVVVHARIYGCPEGHRHHSVVEPMPVVVPPAPPRRLF